MKKIILLSAFIVALTSCSAPTVEETPVVIVDTTCTADTAFAAVCDSAKVDTLKK